MREKLGGFACVRFLTCLLACVLILAVSSSPWAGQKKKKKPDNSNQTPPAYTGPVSDEIDRDIGEMLGAFQVGRVEMMQKYYADNAVFISGAYEPPVVGWRNYAALYERERAAFQGLQLIRRDTFVFTHGDVAWASYEWEFDSMLNDKPYSIRGQTTLIFNKVGDNWLIVHNHTSEICPVASSAQEQPGQQPTQAAPAQTPPASPPQP